MKIKKIPINLVSIIKKYIYINILNVKRKTFFFLIYFLEKYIGNKLTNENKPRFSGKEIKKNNIRKIEKENTKIKKAVNLKIKKSEITNYNHILTKENPLLNNKKKRINNSKCNITESAINHISKTSIIKNNGKVKSIINKNENTNNYDVKNNDVPYPVNEKSSIININKNLINKYVDNGLFVYTNGYTNNNNSNNMNITETSFEIFPESINEEGLSPIESSDIEELPYKLQNNDFYIESNINNEDISKKNNNIKNNIDNIDIVNIKKQELNEIIKDNNKNNKVTNINKNNTKKGSEKNNKVKILNSEKKQEQDQKDEDEDEDEFLTCPSEYNGIDDIWKDSGFIRCMIAKPLSPTDKDDEICTI